jgi:hypothetical protein
MSNFSDLVRARSQRRLIANGAMWGAYGQLVAVSGPIFSGLALWMGLRASDIALVASIAALAGLIQPFSFLVARTVRDQKRFVIGFGIVEVTLVCGVALVPLIVRGEGPRFGLAAALTLGGTIMGNLVGPLFNSWFSSVITDDARARFLGRRLVLVNIAAMAVAYGSGQLIDLVQGKHIGFGLSYLIGWLTGLGGYFLLSRIPFPSVLKVEGEISFDRALVAPLKHRQFRSLLLFYLTWVAGVMIADPFYSVFMIRDLQVSYATIGVLNAVVLAVGILGYQFWGGVVERYGGKPVLQLLMVPRFVLPLIWVFLTPRNHGVVLPAIMVTNGLVFSGMTVAVNTLLFGSVPTGSEAALFFATWAFTNSLVNSASSAAGGVISRLLADASVALGPLVLGNIKILFVISSAVMVIPFFLIRSVPDTRAKTVTYLLGQMLRGNPLAFVYNSFVFSRLRTAGAKARAARAMGRSRSPMAVDRLVRALDDADPEVREQAVKGLGETRSEEALTPLLRELADEESDVRAEAAESIGKLRHPGGVEPLLQALAAPDVRIATSAARALGDIGGIVVKDRLFEHLAKGPDKALLPTLVESLSRLADMRVVAPALEALGKYKSPVIRLQLINAACRALGAGNIFYDLLSKDDLELAEKLDQMLESMGRELKRVPLGRRQKAVLLDRHAALRTAFEAEWFNDMPGLALNIALRLPAKEPRVAAAVSALRIYSEAVDAGRAERPEIFAVVCLGVAADASV